MGSDEFMTECMVVMRGYGFCLYSLGNPSPEMQFGSTGLRDTIITNIQSQIQTQAYRTIQAEKLQIFNSSKWKIKRLFRKIPVKTALQN